MKKGLITLLFVAIAITAMAQQWELDFGNQNDINQHSRIDAGMIDANEDAVLIGRFGRRRDWNTQLIKVHPDGSYERHVCEDLPKMLLFKDVVQLKNGNYFTVATRIQDTTIINYGGNELWAIVFNSNLDLLATQIYTHGTLELINSPRLLLEDDGNVVACGEWYETLYWYFPYMYRFNENADTLACRYEKPENYVYNDPIFQMHDFQCYKIFKNLMEDGYIFLCDHGGLGAVFYDENFQYKKAYRYGTSSYIFALGDRGYSDYLLSDNSMLVFGTRYPEDDDINNYHLCLADLDLGGSKERANGIVNRFVTNFHHEENRHEEQSQGKSMATVNDTTMYGCYYTWYNSGENVQAGLCLFDRDMEILGGRFFDEDEYYKFGPQFVLPYSDGGCLLVMDGGEYLSVYKASKVMKLTREEMNPIPTSVKEMPLVEIQGKVYPNPAHDELNIDISGLTGHEGCRISITDALGRPCVDRFIRGEGNVLTMGISGLKTGVYGYRVYNTDNELLKGKFIKE
ncbi:MAG: T9SS type A sorting domain-containing protein [Bacteroidaceae bacterium]|nr:T9SS type A sorting domain-containing protein [Bacteroidaceae bacterium]